MAWVIGKSFVDLSWAKMMPALRKRGDTSSPHLRDATQALLRDPPRQSTQSKQSRQSAAELDELIEGEIIPRLMMAHSFPAKQAKAPGNAKISREEAERFSMLALTADTAQLMIEVDTFLARGVSVETILIDLLAPSARRLGKCWEDDVCDFVDVTLGLAALHEVLREVALRSPGMIAQVAGPRTALFTPMPGDQHHFGALMIEEVFNRGGWNSGSLIAPSKKELLDEVAGQSLDLVGLTLSTDCSSRALSGLITAIRSVSANPRVQVLIGGQMVNANPLMADEVGADGTAEDAKSALILADQLVMTTRSLLLSAA